MANPPSVTVYPPSVTVNPPSVIVNPPSVTVNSPSVTVNSPSVTVNPPSVTCKYMDECSKPGVLITYTLNSSDLNLTDNELYRLYSTEWINFPGYSTGSIVPASDMTPEIIAPCDLPAGFIGAMYGGVIPITLGFNISPSRICGLTIITTPADLTTATTLSLIKFTFKLTDINLQSPPLANDYLPAGILNQWIVDWLTAFSFTTNNSPPPAKIPEKYLTQDFQPLYAHFTSHIPYKKNYNINKNIEKYSGVATRIDSGYSMSPRSIINNQPNNQVNNKVNNKVNTYPYSIADYIFYLSYPVSFTGAFFYGLISIMQMDPSTIIANRNMSIIINVYIGLCAIISIFIWFNINVNIFSSINYNFNSSKRSFN